VTHIPVLTRAAVDGLEVRSDGVYVDCTFGRGGHTRALLACLGPAGRVLALDRDPRAISVARELAQSEPRLSVFHSTFDQLAQIVANAQLLGELQGVLFDLGVSSPQLDDAQRGFSFRNDGPLDMRMDPSAGVPVSDWLNVAQEKEIGQVLMRYGEETHARRIARSIVQARADKPLTSTRELSELVRDAYPARARHGARHPATKTFQALRIFVNEELQCLEAALPQALECLAPGGRLAVISFHSLEDRMVKRFFRAQHRAPGPKDLPIQGTPTGELAWLSKAIRADEAEVAANPRARSATLRVAQKRRDPGDELLRVEVRKAVRTRRAPC
jgi:16S rRNA (cytosine1402-N4)-methyltransferase